MPFLHPLASIASRFRVAGSIEAIEPLGSGNVNDTYRVSLSADGEAVPGETSCFVLQRVNPQVFPRPLSVMRNFQACTEHVGARLGRGEPLLASRRWEVPRLLPVRDSDDSWLEHQGEFWRAITFIAGARTIDAMESPRQAREVGRALGTFHHLISDLPVEKLSDTLPGFHITPAYLDSFDRIRSSSTQASTPELEATIAFVEQRRRWASVLEEARRRGELRERPIHGDPKVNNILLEEGSDRAIALIDLDTVKPGLIHYDIGDCLRSGCNRAGEEAEDPREIAFDLDLCAAILEGYGSIGRGFLRQADYDYLHDAIRLIPFELGLRFLTDHLAGNVYFKTRFPGHNLKRALVQFRLTESIESQAREISALIGAMR